MKDDGPLAAFLGTIAAIVVGCVFIYALFATLVRTGAIWWIAAIAAILGLFFVWRFLHAPPKPRVPTDEEVETFKTDIFQFMKDENFKIHDFNRSVYSAAIVSYSQFFRSCGAELNWDVYRSECKESITRLHRALPDIPPEGSLYARVVDLLDWEFPARYVGKMAEPLVGVFPVIKKHWPSYTETDLVDWWDIGNGFYGPNADRIARQKKEDDKLVAARGQDYAQFRASFRDTIFFPMREHFETAFSEMCYPYSFPLEARFEHMHIVAGTGHGKTQTLQALIVDDMKTDAGLVIIDSQGEMLEKIERMQSDKEIVYIDPTDVDHPPALNMFDVSRLEGLPQAKREQFLNGLIELLEYVFAGLLKAELTQKQNVLFRYTLRLMLAVPNATIIDLVRFLSDPAPYLKHAETLNPMAREFFDREFSERSYHQTREQIRRRLYGVLENDAFRRMFSADRNAIDIAAALDRGAVVLVDTAKSHLKADASALMGRYFIALTLQAALERKGATNPAFLYIDEAGEYFDDNIDSLLNEARKRRVGIVMAHQYLDQLTPQLRSSIATNTSIKLAGGVSDKDARALAPDMRTEPQAIITRPKLSFMCFVKNQLDKGVAMAIIPGVLESQPQREPPRLLPDPQSPRQVRPGPVEVVRLQASSWAPVTVPATPPSEERARPEKAENQLPPQSKNIKPTNDW